MSADAAPQLCLPPRPLAAIRRAVLPIGAIDTHFHVFAEGAPLNTPRSYDPQILTIDDWLAFAEAFGIERGVLVQPSVYGLDNSVLLAALDANPERLRGVVVIDPATSRAELQALHKRGVRGVRINTRNKGGLALSAAKDFAAGLADLGWSLQLQVRPEQLGEIAAIAASLPLPLVIDHLGFIPLGTTETDGHIADLQRLMDAGRVYVKLSAPYRLGRFPDYAGFGAAIGKLLASHPDRLLWGSDWPHTEMWQDMADDDDLVGQMHGWLGKGASQRLVYAGNAHSLFFGR